ncbi:MAG: oligosaccharide flippase family protein, partial [Gemmatimonadales bacterium]|nr:oligosaccharide flippase family protein [Gemmatimonadales bacterium]
MSRLLLVVLFVELGRSIEGAVLGSIGASLIELAVCRFFVRPAFSLRAAFQVGKLWGYAAPLLLSAVALRLYDKLDLVALTALGGTPEQAGHYGAAQNLAILPSL